MITSHKSKHLPFILYLEIKLVDCLNIKEQWDKKRELIIYKYKHGTIIIQIIRTGIDFYFKLNFKS